MATYNSAVYAQETGQSSTAVGVATPIPTYTDGKRSGGTKKAIFVVFDTSLQNLATSSVLNICTLPADVIVTAITMTADTATTSATTQIGITGTAGYYSTSAVATATAASFNMFTNLSNFSTPTTANAAPITVIATFAGAAVNTGKLYFLIEYLSN